MDAVFDWVARYGYGALFLLLMLGVVGLPVPDETLLVFTGYLVSKGTFNPVGALVTAVCGSWCGISLSFGIGRTLGIQVVHRFGKYVHVSEAQLDKVHLWFDRRGHWALFGGYYVAGVRHLTAILAGASGLRFPVFVLYAWSGGLLWATGFLTLGYFIGENWRHIAELIHQYLLYLSIGLIVVALAYWMVRRRKRS